MNFYKNMIDFTKLFRMDEKLLRLIYYRANSLSDDIMQITPIKDPTKPVLADGSNGRPALTPHLINGHLDPTVPYIGDILYQKIRTEQIVPANQYYDTSSIAQNRLCFYLGPRRRGKNDYIQNQQLYIDVWVHSSFEIGNTGDYRMEKICDYLSDELFMNYITGIGKVDEYTGRDLKLTPASQYYCYELVYEFGSSKDGRF